MPGSVTKVCQEIEQEEEEEKRRCIKHERKAYCQGPFSMSQQSDSCRTIVGHWCRYQSQRQRQRRTFVVQK